MLVSRTGLSPVMVGRDAELGQLLRLLGVHSGSSVALVGGEPGIGKTRLVSELIGALPPKTTVLTGQADPGALGQPYHLLCDLVGDPTADLGGPDATPQARLQGGLDLLRAHLGDGLTVLVVDDLHWADAESMSVIERLLEVPAGRLLVVGTYRPEELTRQHPVAELVQRLERRHTVVHLRLERLSPAEVSGFLAAVFGRPPSHRSTGALHQRTGGNPFFLEELLKASGATDPDKVCIQPLPWTLAEALRSQLDDLAPPARLIVEAAAVLGARVSFDLLAAVTGLAEPELIGLLRDLVGRGLLVETEEDQFGFRHALTREVIAGEMLGRERRRLHEAALEVLRAAPKPDLASIAMHARGAGRYADMVAAARDGSAQRLAAGSTYAALKLAEVGLEEDPEDIGLLATASNAAWLAGYHEDAYRYANRWLAGAPDAPGRSAALRVLVRIAWETADIKTMEARTSDVCAVVETLPDGEERARAYAALAQSHMLRFAYPEAIAWADRAIEAGRRLDLPEVWLTALVEKGTAMLSLPDSHDEGEAMLLAAADEAERHGAYLAASRAIHNVFWQAKDSSVERLTEMLLRMRADAERAGFGGVAVGGYHEGRSWIATISGDLDGSIAALLDIGRPDGDWPPSPRVTTVTVPLAELYLERGDLDLAEEMLRDVPTEAPYWLAAESLTFQMACWRGDLGRARALLADLVGGAGDPQDEELHAESVHLVVSAGLSVGLGVEELSAAVSVDGVLRRTGHRRVPDTDDHPMRRLILAQLAEASGRTEEALDGYRATTASTHVAALGYRKGTAYTGAARCLLALGRPAEARTEAQAAADLLARWPGWRRAELDPVLRRLGMGNQPAPTVAPTATGADALTPREREVAALLAEGLTNSELARRLVISRKTAAVHVSNILAKLGMTSRAQIAAWASREGVTGSA